VHHESFPGEEPGGDTDRENRPRIRSFLPINVDAARAARETLRPFRKHVSTGTAGCLHLAATELATNAYRHGRRDGRMVLSADLEAEHVRLAITNPCGKKRPAIRMASEAGGWGLRLLDRIATEWGVKDDGDRTAVWARIPRWL
jgi:anti-sigma regulatory factor (Ser/Thr protein kinase)